MDHSDVDDSKIDRFLTAWLIAGREQIGRIRTEKILPKRGGIDLEALIAAKKEGDKATAMLHWLFPKVLKTRITNYSYVANKYKFCTSDGITIRISGNYVTLRDTSFGRLLRIRDYEDRWVCIVNRRRVLSHLSGDSQRLMLVAYNTFLATRDHDEYWDLPS